MGSVPHDISATSPFISYLVHGAQLDPQRVIGTTITYKLVDLACNCKLPTFHPTHKHYIMSSIVNKIKDAASGNKGDSNNNEQSFSIQPHPAVRGLKS